MRIWRGCLQSLHELTMTMSRVQHIMVTGAGGFVGSRLVARLRERSPDIRLSLVDHKRGRAGRDEIYQLDVSDEAGVAAFMAEMQPTTVVHLAAVSAISNAMADQRLTWRTNALGPYNIMMAILEHVPDCHLIFVSSAEVYGRSAAAGVKLTEQHLLQPTNPYASAKAAADLLIQEASGRGLTATIMRPFNHIGPGQSLAFAIPSFCSQIVDIERGGEPVIRVGSLEDVRDFLHVDDVIDAYLAVVDQRETIPPGTVFNVASGVPVRMQHVLDTLVAASTTKMRTEIDESRLRGRAPTSVVGDASKLRTMLGWTPRRTLEDALIETVEYWRAQK
jgi:GDP-4-dehydro-6-deoxy-D-mannose reductase